MKAKLEFPFFPHQSHKNCHAPMPLDRFDTDTILREQIAAVLQAGLPTQWRERAYSGEVVNAIAAELRTLGSDDILNKLQIAGFTLHAFEGVDEGLSQDGEVKFSQACETCMYFELHRQFCALPELMLPVRPEWSCRLWRI